MVRCDALHIGARCVKKGQLKGVCDLCYVLLGHRVPETTKHICMDCPFTRPVITAVWSMYQRCVQPHTLPLTSNLTWDEYCGGLERRMIFGVTEFDPDPIKPPKKLTAPTVTLAAATNAALIRRRNNNALCPSLPLQHDTNTVIANIVTTLCTVATALRTVAEREEDRIYTDYEGWLPPDEDLPTSVWHDAWCAYGQSLLHSTQPRTRPQFAMPLPAAAPHPTYDVSDPAVVARGLHRSHPQPPPPT